MEVLLIAAAAGHANIVRWYILEASIGTHRAFYLREPNKKDVCKHGSL